MRDRGFTLVEALVAVFIVLAAGARFLGPRGRRWLVLVSAFVLGILGIYQVIVGTQKLLHGALTR